MSKNENEGPHGHWWYDPNTMRMGYHGENHPTRANHPNSSSIKNFTQYEYNKDAPEFKTEMELAREHGMSTYSYTNKNGQMNVLVYPGNSNTENTALNGDKAAGVNTAENTGTASVMNTTANTAVNTTSSVTSNEETAANTAGSGTAENTEETASVPAEESSTPADSNGPDPSDSGSGNSNDDDLSL